jgi:hypothetical protein
VLTLWCYSLSAQATTVRFAVNLLVLALLGFLAALLSAEGGVAAGALIGAYLLCLDRRPLWLRWLSMLPFLVALVLVRLSYQEAGFGAANSGAYFDPLTDTQAYLSNLLLHAPYLLLDQVTGSVSLTYILSPAALLQRAVIVSVFLLVLALTWWPLLKHSARARFFLVSSLLALLPLGATTFIGGRLMLISSLGITALLGLFIWGVVTRAPWLPVSRVYRGWAGLVVMGLLTSNLIYKGVYMHAAVGAQLETVGATESAAETSQSDLGKLYNGQSSTLVLMNPPSVFEQVFYVARARDAGLPTPSYTRALVPGIGGVVVQRLDARRLRVDSLAESFVISPQAVNPAAHLVYSRYHAAQRSDRLFAGDDYQLEAGQSWRLPGLTVTVLVVNDQGLPTSVEFLFARELESTDYQWLCWDYDKGGYQNCLPPSPGQSLTLAASWLSALAAGPNQ